MFKIYLHQLYIIVHIYLGDYLHVFDVNKNPTNEVFEKQKILLIFENDLHLNCGYLLILKDVREDAEW